MKAKKEYLVFFSNLKEGLHEFDFNINQSFFEEFNFEPDFTEIKLEVHLQLEKKTTFLELFFSIKGSAVFECDLTLEPFEQKIESKFKIIVKFGEEYNDENEEILVIPRNTNEIDVAQYIYEAVILTIPKKRIHPDVLSGKMKSEMLDRLEELHTRTETVTEEDTTDTMWKELKKLKN